MSTPDPEVRAIVRNLHEVADAILMRQIDHLITIRTVYIGANLLYLAHKACFFGTFGALVKVLETHNSRAGSFHWLYNKNKDEMDEFARSRNYDLTSLWSLAGRARDIRNKTLFHIDKKGLLNPKEIWKEANVSGFDVGRALETAWHCLQHLHRVKTGGYYISIPALERQPTERTLDHTVEVVEQTEVSLETLSPTNLRPTWDNHMRSAVWALSILTMCMGLKEAHANNTVFWSGLRLLQACEDPDVSEICTFYIMGVHDQNDILRAWKMPNPIGSYCLPDTGDSRQLVATVVRFMQENPAQLHYDAPTVIVTALVQAFPCR